MGLSKHTHIELLLFIARLAYGQLNRSLEVQELSSVFSVIIVAVVVGVAVVGGYKLLLFHLGSLLYVHYYYTCPDPAMKSAVLTYFFLVKLGQNFIFLYNSKTVLLSLFWPFLIDEFQCCCTYL